jgi:hypothetical protein
VNEETSSSESGLHFGHYIVGSKSDTIAHYHTARVTVILAHAIQLERWSRGLSVMPEKMLGVMLVTKLRAILLMEAYFNALNKFIYGVRMMEQARKYRLMPDEIYSEKNRMADDGTLTKTLFLTPHIRPGYWQPLPQSTHQIATTGLLTQLPGWSFNCLVCQNQQLSP